MNNSLFDSQALGTNGFYWWIGQIADDSTWRDNCNPSAIQSSEEDDPGWGYRYRVRIFGNQTFSKEEEPDEELPMAEVLYPVTAGSGHRGSKMSPNLCQGAFVMGFFKDGFEAQQPVIMGAFGNNSQTILKGKDPEKGFEARTGYKGKSEPVPVYPQNMATAPRSLPALEGMNPRVGSIADIFQANDGADEMTMQNSCEAANTEMQGIQGVMSLLLRDINRMKKSASLFPYAAAGEKNNMERAIDRAEKAICGFVKSIMSRVNALVLKKVNNSITPAVSLLMPNERPALQQKQEEVTNTVTCVMNGVVDMMCGIVRELLNDVVEKFVSSPTCAAKSFVSSLLDKILGPVVGILGTAAGGIQDFIDNSVSHLPQWGNAGSLFGMAGGDPRGALDTVTSIVEFFGCDPQPECPPTESWSAWNGGGVLGEFHGALGGVLDAIESEDSACNSGPTSCGPPKVLFIKDEVVHPLAGGAEGNAIVNGYGQVIGVDLVYNRWDPLAGPKNGGAYVKDSSSGGSGWGYKTPPKVKIIDECGKGGGANLISVINKWGQVVKVVSVSPGVGYTNIFDGSKGGNGQIFSDPGNTIVNYQPTGILNTLDNENHQAGLGTGGFIGDVTTGSNVIDNVTNPEGSINPGQSVIPINIPSDINFPSGTTIIEYDPLGGTNTGGTITISDTPYGIGGGVGITTIGQEFITSVPPPPLPGLPAQGIITEIDDNGAVSAFDLSTGGSTYPESGSCVGTKVENSSGIDFEVDYISENGIITQATVCQGGSGYEVGQVFIINGSGTGDTDSDVDVNAGNFFDITQLGGYFPYSPGTVVNVNPGDTVELPPGTCVDIVKDGITVQTLCGTGKVIAEGSFTTPFPLDTAPKISSNDPASALGDYPVILQLVDVYIDNPGINYDPNDTIFIKYNNGAVLEPKFGPFGTVTKVNIISKGQGFNRVPRLWMESEVGTNAKLIPVFEPLRIGSDEEGNLDRLEGTPVLQVIDCVGKVT